MIRQEVLDLFCQFMKDNRLSVSDLLVVAECCVREVSARGAVEKKLARQAVELLLEANQP